MTVKTKLAQVKSRIAEYCSSLNLNVPKVITREEDFEAWRLERRNRMAHGADRPAIADRFGATFRKQRTIFINVDKINDEKKLDLVIRRELIHLAKPSYYRTRPAFKNCLNRLKDGNVRNGRFFTPKKQLAVAAK